MYHLVVFLLVSISAIDCMEKLVSKMTYYVLSRTDSVCVIMCVVDSNSEPTAPGEPNGIVAGYSHGLAVKTGLQLPSTSVSPNMVNQFGKNYLLTLPQRTMAGGCTWSAPVRFLVDSRDVCDIEVTSRSCSGGSQLDALMYVPSTDWGIATGPLVVSEQAVNSIAKTDVNFLCVGGSTSFIKSTKTRAQSFLPNSELCFASNDTCRVVGDCFLDPTTSAFVCPGNIITWLTEQPTSSRCSFDNGFTVPPTPSFNNVTGVCSNAVVAVEYNVTWSGQTVTHLNAIITLADISAAESSNATDAANMTFVSQNFVVAFVGNTSHAAVSNSSSDRSTMVYPPSGNPGKSSVDYDLMSFRYLASQHQ